MQGYHSTVQGAAKPEHASSWQSDQNRLKFDHRGPKTIKNSGRTHSTQLGILQNRKKHKSQHLGTSGMPLEDGTWQRQQYHDQMACHASPKPNMVSCVHMKIMKNQIPVYYCIAHCNCVRKLVPFCSACREKLSTT